MGDMGDDLKKIEPKVTHRCCPKCGYLVAQVEIEMSIYAYDCPRCDSYNFNKFQPLKLKGDL